MGNTICVENISRIDRNVDDLRQLLHEFKNNGVIKYIWAIFDFPAGKRLAPFLPEIIAVLENPGELEFLPEVRSNFLTISSATIGRLLSSKRKRLELKGLTGTKPGSLLKNSNPINTFANWNNTRPGFIEIDFVAHNGDDPRSDFTQSLNAVDVATGWTQIRAVKSKTQKGSLKHCRTSLKPSPFPP